MHGAPSRKIEWLVWSSLGLAIGLVLGAFLHSRIAGFRGPVAAPLPVLGVVTGFTLTNQNATPTTAADLRGAPWLGQVIFTRCPGPCVRMTRNLATFQERLPRNSPLRFVTLTADPAHDTPDVLRRYGERFGADPRRWLFLTGAQTNLYDLATRQLLLAVGENPDPANARPEDLFIHSSRMVLVDAAGRVRAAYDGESPGSQDQVLTDLRRLEAESPAAAHSPHP